MMDDWCETPGCALQPADHRKSECERSTVTITIAGHITTWPDGRFRFPTISSCLVCGGVTDIVRPYPEHARYAPDEALRVALIEHGYMLAKWEGHNVANVHHVPRACTCGHLHDWTPVTDRPWPGSVCCVCQRFEARRDSSD